MTIYMDPAGSDSNSGSISSPVKTLPTAADKAMSDGSRHVQARAGTYNVTSDGWKLQNINASNANRLIIENYPGETAIFDGTNMSGDTDTDSVIKIQSCEGITFRHNPNDSYTVGTGSSYELVVRNNNTGRGIHIYQSVYVTVDGVYMHDIETRGIGGSGDNVTVSNCTMIDIVMENENEAYGGVGGWASGLSFTNWFSSGAENNNINIFGNHCEKFWGEGIGPWRTLSGSVHDNRILDTYSVGLYLNQVEGIDIYDNEIVCTSATYEKNGRLAHLIQMSNENISGGEAMTQDMDIYNNLCVGGDHQLRFWDDGSDGDSGNRYLNIGVYHNVFLGGDDETFGFEAPSGGNGSLTLKNNIIYDGATGALNVSGLATHWTWADNDWPDGVPASIGTSNGDFSADPQFTTALASIDTLTEAQLSTGASACVDVGSTDTGVTVDAFGNARDATPDVGLHEWNGDPPEPPASAEWRTRAAIWQA